MAIYFPQIITVTKDTPRWAYCAYKTSSTPGSYNLVPDGEDEAEVCMVVGESYKVKVKGMAADGVTPLTEEVIQDYDAIMPSAATSGGATVGSFVFTSEFTHPPTNSKSAGSWTFTITNSPSNPQEIKDYFPDVSWRRTGLRNNWSSTTTHPTPYFGSTNTGYCGNSSFTGASFGSPVRFTLNATQAAGRGMPCLTTTGGDSYEHYFGVPWVGNTGAGTQVSVPGYGDIQVYSTGTIVKVS